MEFNSIGPLSPSLILVIVTSVISIWGFNNENLVRRCILSPYMVYHEKQWYRIFTHAFVHADFMHLLFNMIALWSFGAFVYSCFSYYPNASLNFYILYFGAILISSVHDLVKYKNIPDFLSLGASGAVSAVVFSGIFFNPWSMILIFVIPCPGILFGVLYLIYCRYMARRSGDNINHNAHLYGSLFGFIYPLLIDPSLFWVFLYNLLHPRF